MRRMQNSRSSAAGSCLRIHAIRLYICIFPKRVLAMFKGILEKVFGTPEEIAKKNAAYRIEIGDQVKRLIVRHSLSCNSCNSLSAPILGTTDRYKCGSCGRQFVSSSHRMDDILRANFTNIITIKIAKEVYSTAAKSI